MIRGFALLALVGVALCAPVNFIDEVPPQYKDLIPEEVVNVLKGLTDADKAALKEVAANYKDYKTEEEGLAALKEKNADTYEKVKKLHDMVKTKIEALGDEAKAFAKEVIEEVRKVHTAYISGQKPNLETLKAQAVQFVNKFKALSPNAKADFEKQFPILTSVVKNEKFQTLAKGYLGNTN